MLAAVKSLKPGGVSDPVKLEGGYIIVRLDDRTPAGAPTFDEKKVREAISAERIDKERETYLNNLRRDAYVEVSPAYREQVMPLLKAETATPTGTTTAAAPQTSKKNDKKKSELTGNKKP